MDIKINQPARTIFILAGLALIINVPVFGQAWQKLPAKIFGKITRGLNPDDSIVVNINEDNPKWSYKKLTVPVHTDGSFLVVLDTIHQPAAIRMNLKGRNYMLFEREIEPGDSLFLEINAYVANPTNKYSGNIPKYSGNNVGKYSCEDSLDIFRVGWNYRRNQMDKPLTGIKYSYSYYDQVYKFLLAEHEQVTAIIKNFKNRLSPAMFHYLTAKYIAQYIMWSSQLRFQYMQAKDPKVQADIIKSFMAHKLPEIEVNQNIAGYNNSYLSYLVNNIQVETWFENNGNDYPFKRIYDKLKARYKGFLRERLLTYFLYFPGNTLNVQNYSPNDFVACLEDARSIIKDPYLKKVLIQKSSIKSGSPAFPFEFPDTSGKTISLKELKGNVVLIDMWGVGCSGCALFYKMFEKEVQPYLKNEPGFKFVSLNVDNSKDRWRTGIRSGLYTNPTHINLYMEGKGMQHPYAKYYNIVAAPFIILVDKNGNLITKIEIGLSGSEVLKLIRSALLQEQS
ncbi:thiol-disulfide isomerase/thioredoxin [Pedobacter sp. AK017]|uniref:TlpA family protein disulfide reductase n=1 Tax=Pedobacter sp. AK017 TaxID=2723073 RepID=UPI00161F32F4|nr:TlpA disulfide reductase family protein [Pedobacter sp. AK017]MBB5437726.1 thiol-disulfide isomerase/thioredoxin [Pedobacter sp. AK017]